MSILLAWSSVAAAAPPEDPVVPEIDLAADWLGYEERADEHKQRGERVFFPSLLAIEAGLGVALAASGDSVLSGRSRALFGVASGLAAAAIFPTVSSRSRAMRRMWFGVGSAAYALAFGAGLISYDGDQRASGGGPGSLRFLGASTIVQGVALLPLAFIAELPDDADYAMLRELPPHSKREQAARLLARIDRYERHGAAIVVMSNVLAAGVLTMGAALTNEQSERKTLGLISIAPYVSALAVLPRLFVRPRLDRFLNGERATRLPLNAW